jgi:hypothetical protein
MTTPDKEPDYFDPEASNAASMMSYILGAAATGAALGIVVWAKNKYTKSHDPLIPENPEDENGISTSYE